MRAAFAILAWAACAAAWLGCASLPYEYGHDLETDLTLRLRPDEPQIDRGRPNAFVDGIGNYVFSLPSKLLLLNWKMNNHHVSEATEAELHEYLAANGLCNVKVRLNQYAPGGEWSRLARNREMPGAWRWTFGLLSVSFYTILPDRVFAGLLGGDSYNPYTNTISIYSDLEAVGLHEGGHAKDFAEVRNRHWRGLYAVVRILPLVPLWQEGAATSDAIGWVKTNGDAGDEKGAYRTLYPAYGTYVGGEASQWVPAGWIAWTVRLGAVAVGHLAGQVRALFVRERPGAPGSAAEDVAAPPPPHPPDQCAPPPAEDALPTPL